MIVGWDFKVRVYFCKIFKEVVVLEWYKVGCYVVVFFDMGVMEVFDGSFIFIGEGNLNF